MKKVQNFNKFITKTNSLKNNYTIFLENKKNLQYSLQSFQRKRQDYFFFKKSMKNILQFLFKKGEKKKVYSLVKKMFLTKQNTKFLGNKNYTLYKVLYKVLFSNTPYMNFLDLPPKNARRFRGKKSRKKRNKTLFLVPILPRVQKRIQANWFLKSMLNKNKNLNLTQSFLNELAKVSQSQEWMLKESNDFYNSAMESFMRFGRKSIKVYKNNKKISKTTNWNNLKSKKRYSILSLNYKTNLQKKLLSLHKEKFSIFNNDYKEVLTYNKTDLFPIKNVNLINLKKKKKRKQKISDKTKKISLIFSRVLKKKNLDNFFKSNNNLITSFNKLDEKFLKTEAFNLYSDLKLKSNKIYYLESFIKNTQKLKDLNLYQPYNIKKRLLSKEFLINLKDIHNFNELLKLNELSNKKVDSNFTKKKLIKQKENHKKAFLTKKIVSKSLQWFKIK